MFFFVRLVAEIELIKGGTHTDDRGTVSFVNVFSPKAADRFYTIRSKKPGEPRGWIGHKIEHKWFVALAGDWLIAAVKPDNWSTPSSSLPVERFNLSADKPTVLHVSPGNACAMVMLTDDSLLGVFSSGKIEDAEKDDWRFDITWWQVNP